MISSQAVSDSETRSELNLAKVSAIVYAQHHSTSIFCLGYKIDDGPTLIWIPERAPMPRPLWRHIKRGGIIVAQNAGFERAILRFTLPRYPLITRAQRRVLRSMPASQFRCTAAKAAASSLPRKLEMAAHVLRLPTRKDIAGHKLIKKYCKPRKPSKKNPKTWWDDKDDLRSIYRYCITDVEAEYELDQALPDLSDEEQTIWELDQKINDRGVLLDILTVKIILDMIHEEMGNITREVQKLSGGEVASPAQVGKMLAWVNERGAEMTNLQAQTVRDKLEEDDLDGEVRQMLEYRQGGSKTSTGKYIAMLSAVSADHRARELLLYNATIPTARWGGKRVQPHNFPRPTVKGFNSDEAIELIKSGGIKAIRKKYGKTKVMDVLVSAIRGMIIASPGHDLFCGDWSAIEARLAFWVAEHEEGLNAFRMKRKLYEEMAAEAFDMDIVDVLKDSLERFVGKESVLGCQYGMGPPKFKSQCHKKGMKSVTDAIARKAVYTYRKVHSPVTAFWRVIELAVISAIQNPGTKYLVTKVVVYTHGDWLNIKLPSGRRLRYFKPRITQKQLAGGRLVPEIRFQTMEKHQWREVAGWGGVFLNHICQGIARDLMAFFMGNIEDAGYKFLLSVHDEGLSERKTGFGSLKEYIAIMKRLPSWAESLPLEAEGWTGKRYRK